MLAEAAHAAFGAASASVLTGKYGADCIQDGAAAALEVMSRDPAASSRLDTPGTAAVCSQAPCLHWRDLLEVSKDEPRPMWHSSRAME